MKVKKRFVSKGHLIDSGILASILNLTIKEGADYEINKFKIGKTNLEPSSLDITVICSSQKQLAALEKKLIQTGCYEFTSPEPILKTAKKDGCAPDDFYSTTNHRTEVYYNKSWHAVKNQRMDAVIVISDEGPVCKKLRDIKKGDSILCSPESVRVFPPERERESSAFGFMSSVVSSERSVKVVVSRFAEELKRIKRKKGKVVAVAGPVVVHTGSAPALAGLIRNGYIHGILSGNALAVHDIEAQYFNTSLGIDLTTGSPTYEGHKNHMRAINNINRHGSIKAAIEAGDLTSGIMYEIVKKDTPYCLAGSIRDDGPLPETATDMIEAQRRYADICRDADIVIMLATMLHAIGTGNMIPSWIKTVCVDINPAVVTKLSDRGSGQTVGVVSDVGLFLQALVQELKIKTEVME